jgi:polyadenylation factor subunit 2
VLPHDSYGKYYFPEHYTKPGSDWEGAAPQFIAECVSKQDHHLFTIKWIKEGKRLITGTKTGEILVWQTQLFESQPTSLHK